MEFDIKLDSFNKSYSVGVKEFYIQYNISVVVNITYSEKSMDFNIINLILTVNFLFIQGSYTIKNNKAQPPTVNLIKFLNKKQKISQFGQMYTYCKVEFLVQTIIFSLKCFWKRKKRE